MQITLLGPVEAASVDGPVVLGGPKPRALLAMLALDAGAPPGLRRALDRRAVGRRAAGDGDEDGAALSCRRARIYGSWRLRAPGTR